MTAKELLRKRVQDNWSKLTELAGAFDDIADKMNVSYSATIYACIVVAVSRASRIRMSQSKFLELCLFFCRISKNKLENRANETFIKPHPRDVKDAIMWVDKEFPDELDFMKLDVAWLRKTIVEALQILPHYDNLYDPESEEYAEAMNYHRNEL